MDFGAALKWMWDENWVRRTGWPVNWRLHIYLPKRDARVKGFYLEIWDGEMLRPWTGSSLDLLAEDWERVPKIVMAPGSGAA